MADITIEQAILELKAAQHYLGYPDALGNAIALLEKTVEMPLAVEAAVEQVIDAVMTVERYAPKTVPRGATAPLFAGMGVDPDGPWLSRVDVAKKLRATLLEAISK